MKTIDMRKRIELELNGAEVSSIKELNLDNCRAQFIDGLTDEFVNLETLSLVDVGLTSLKGFPVLPNLKRLNLGENKISSGFDLLAACTNLVYLNLSGNKIRAFEDLAPLASLNLRNLDLFNSDVSKLEDYRVGLFKALPNVQFLDGIDQNGVEDEEDNWPSANGDSQNGDGEFEVLDGPGKNEEVQEEDEEEAGDETAEEVGLSYLQKDNLEDEEDDEDFDAEKLNGAEGEDDDDDEEDDDEDDLDEDEEEEEDGVDDLSKEDIQQDEDSNSRLTRKRKLEELGEEDSKTQ